MSNVTKLAVAEWSATVSKVTGAGMLAAAISPLVAFVALLVGSLVSCLLAYRQRDRSQLVANAAFVAVNLAGALKIAGLIG